MIFDLFDRPSLFLDSSHLSSFCYTFLLFFFFFNDTATTEIYTLSLHDALPICAACHPGCRSVRPASATTTVRRRTVLVHPSVPPAPQQPCARARHRPVPAAPGTPAGHACARRGLRARRHPRGAPRLQPAAPPRA